MMTVIRKRVTVILESEMYRVHASLENCASGESCLEIDTPSLLNNFLLRFS